MNLDDAHRPLREFWNTNAAWFNASPGQRTPALVDTLLLGLNDRRGSCTQVLDIACGAGRTTRALHRQLAPSMRTVGVDLSDSMIRTARAENDNETTTSKQLAFYEASAEELPFDACTFDLAFCNLGLMIFPNPTAALAEVQRVLVPGGEFRATVWGREERTSLVTLLPQVARKLDIPLQRPARSNFHLGSETALQSATRDSGMRLCRTREVLFPFPFKNGRDACDQMGISLDAPSSRLADLTDSDRQRLVAECEAEADRRLAREGGALMMDLLIGEFLCSV